MNEITEEVEEMKNIRFTVKGNPFGKERPKFARRGILFRHIHRKTHYCMKKRLRLCIWRQQRAGSLKRADRLTLES